MEFHDRLKWAADDVGAERRLRPCTDRRSKQKIAENRENLLPSRKGFAGNLLSNEAYAMLKRNDKLQKARREKSAQETSRRFLSEMNALTGKRPNTKQEKQT